MNKHIITIAISILLIIAAFYHVVAMLLLTIAVIYIIFMLENVKELENKLSKLNSMFIHNNIKEAKLLSKAEMLLRKYK